MSKVWDITQPVDNWERQYARLEYLRIAILASSRTKISIVEPDDELITIMDNWLLPEVKHG